MRAQIEMTAIRQDIDRRLAEKDEEFENTRSVMCSPSRDGHMAITWHGTCHF